MKSLEKLFRIGEGPSSSHTIAPGNAAASFKRLLSSEVTSVHVILYGSLALTGVGHGTDTSIKKNLLPYFSYFSFDTKTKVQHPNEMKFVAMKGDKALFERTYDSLGGGEISSPDDPAVNERDIYPFRTFDEIKEYIQKNHLSDMKEFCLRFESISIDAYLGKVVDVMFSSVRNGLSASGKIIANGNSRLQVTRKASDIYHNALTIQDSEARRTMILSSYAYAVSEGNACHEELVTAPTCGSSGILPAVLYYAYHDLGISKEKIKDSLYLAGMIGNIVKQNASIAGAIGGCQAEVGTATSMASAALCYLDDLSLYQAEYASECAMEHFLGLSCDPVDGYVIIPCIERNGIGTLHAYDSYLYAKYIAPLKKNQVSFDNVVSAMKLTGDALASAYKETALGGLAHILKEQKNEKK